MITILLQLGFPGEQARVKSTWGTVSNNCDVGCTIEYGTGGLSPNWPNTPNPNSVGDIINGGYDKVLLRAYPNPFSDRLKIEFRVQHESHAVLEIYNTLGQRVAVLFDGKVVPNLLQTVEFSTSQAESSIFIYRLQTESGTYYGMATGAR